MTNEQQNYYWIPEGYQEDSPEDRIGKYNHLMKVSHHNKLTEILIECLKFNQRTWARVPGRGTEQAAEMIPEIDAALQQYRELSKEENGK